MLSMQRIAIPFVALSLFACGDGGGDTDSGVDAHHASSDICQRITDACHEVDPGTGPIHDCHETAHDVGTDEACGAIEASCVALCAAAAADGGIAEDGGEEHDAGEHAHDSDAGAAPDAG